MLIKSNFFLYYIYKIISVLVVLIRIWLPVVYDGLELAGSEFEQPQWLENNNLIDWLKTVGIGLVIFSLGLTLGYALGLIPDSVNNWIPGNVAKALLHYFMVAVTIIVVAVPEGLAMSVTLSLAYLSSWKYHIPKKSLLNLDFRAAVLLLFSSTMRLVINCLRRSS